MMDFTPIFQALIALAAAIVTGILIPYIKSKTNAQQQETIIQWIAIAVSAAEQIYAGPGRGEEKKAYVLQWLADRGMKLDGQAVDAAIEAAVYRLKEGII